jgi:hypothetical protein
MVVNKSSATNITAPTAKKKYAASTTTSATVRLFVMSISCTWKWTSHHLGSDVRTLEEQSQAAARALSKPALMGPAPNATQI